MRTRQGRVQKQMLEESKYGRSDKNFLLPPSPQEVLGGRSAKFELSIQNIWLLGYQAYVQNTLKEYIQSNYLARTTLSLLQTKLAEKSSKFQGEALPPLPPPLYTPLGPDVNFMSENPNSCYLFQRCPNSILLNKNDFIILK